MSDCWHVYLWLLKYSEKYLGLTIRVAGYTAYLVELAEDLQNEIIERTCFGMS